MLAELHAPGIGAGSPLPGPGAPAPGVLRTSATAAAPSPSPRRAADRILSLPMHPGLTVDQQVRVAEALKAAT